MKSFLKSLFWMSIIGLGLASFLPHLFPNYGLTDIFSHSKLQYIILLLLLLLSGFYIQKAGEGKGPFFNWLFYGSQIFRFQSTTA